MKDFKWSEFAREYVLGLSLGLRSGLRIKDYGLVLANSTRQRTCGGLSK